MVVYLYLHCTRVHVFCTFTWVHMCLCMGLHVLCPLFPHLANSEVSEFWALVALASEPVLLRMTQAWAPPYSMAWVNATGGQGRTGMHGSAYSWA